MIKKTLALLALAIVTTTAQAGTSTPAPAAKGVIPSTVEPGSISYNNASLGYLRNSADLGNGSTLGNNGIAAALEYSPDNNLYVAAGGSFSEVRNLGANDDYWTAYAGVSGYSLITSNIHFATEVGASYIQGAGRGSDWGIYVTPHIRAKLGKFETHLGATYNSNDLALDEWTGFLRLLYEVAPNTDLYVTGSVGLTENNNLQDLYSLQAGVRLKF